jgi:hypothetical protein
VSISSGSTRFIALTILSFAAWGCDSDPNAPAPPNPPISYASASGPTDVSDGHGKAWRQLIVTTGRSWTQVAQVCPRDGATPCNGAAGGRDLTGWVWATAEQVRALLAGVPRHYERGLVSRNESVRWRKGWVTPGAPPASRLQAQVRQQLA